MILIVISTIIALASCSHPPDVNAEGPYWKDNDRKGIAEPPFYEPSLGWIITERTVFDQALELLDLDRNVRKLSGNPTQAKNRNSFDEVPNCSWFSNRQGLPQTRMTPQEIIKGPHLTEGPDTTGVWKLFRPKIGGTTPGFWIEDSRGDQYLIKFDLPANPELATSAAAMGSRYFYACGYNVSQETIVYWSPERLVIREGATIRGPDGVKRPLRMEDVDKILADVYRDKEGRIRSIASLNIGNVKGPFMFEGVRKDDPNDWCPHEHRRELRGLYVISSFVNHHDVKDHNSMDVYIGDDGEGYLMHYLMDFGSTFGSAGGEPKAPYAGFANLFDLKDVYVSLFTLGLKKWAWQDARLIRYPSIGYFDAESFRPEKFDPQLPNPAFEQLTWQDAYWGAKIVMSFSDDDLAALVESGQFSNPQARDYLLSTLIARRDKIGRYWMTKVNPLDYPRIEQSENKTVLQFDDLWSTGGLGGGETAYKYEVRFNGKVIMNEVTTRESAVEFLPKDLSIMQAKTDDCGGNDDCGLFQVRIRTKRGESDWSNPAIFWLRLRGNDKTLTVVGIEHPG